MASHLIFIALAGMVGILLPFQAVINARLGVVLGGVFHAALVNFLIGGLAIALIFVSARLPLPGPAQWARVQPWMLLGGVMGAALVSVSTLAVPRIGALALLVLIIGGQFAGSMLIDHFGLLGMTERPLGAARIAGLLLVSLGIALILRG